MDGIMDRWNDGWANGMRDESWMVMHLPSLCHLSPGNSMARAIHWVQFLPGAQKHFLS